MALIGREEDVRSLVARQGKLVLLIGDSGVGKSEVLGAGQSDSSLVLAPSPIHLRSAPGALQRGLLESLAEAMTQVVADQSTADRVGRLIVDSARRVADIRLKDLAAGVARQLLGVISSRVSPELSEVLSSFGQQLVTAVDSELSARINNAADQDVVDLLCGFASEVRTFAAGRNLVLALDDGDRLDDSDLRRLADLSTYLPEAITIRVAFSTWNVRKREQADELVRLGVDPVELEGLTESNVREWLVAEDLPEAWAPRVHRTTNGYALHVAAAIELLKETRSIKDLDGMDRADVIGAATRQVWRELDLPSRFAAQRLTAFATPLESEEVANYLDMDPMAWRMLERNLSESRVFTGHPPWFHELRRRYIWSAILDDDDRIEILSAATRYRGEQLALPAAKAEAFVEYAELTALEASLIDQDPHIAAVMAADRNEVGIAAALIELAQPTPAPLNADSVLLYAQQIFGVVDDLPGALRRLGEKGFVHIASDDRQTMLVPTWGSVEIARLFAGRAAGELGRLPTPLLATTVFDAGLRPRLGTFRSASYGIGTPAIWQLSQQASQLQRVQADGSILMGRAGPNLLLRYEYEGLPSYAVLVYDEIEERDAAAVRLAGRSEVIHERALSIIDCLRDPTDCVPSLRFFLAMERLRGTSLVNAVNGPSTRTPKLAVPMALEDEMLQRARTLEAIRELCTPIERLAASLEKPIGYLYQGSTEESLAIHVIGRGGAERFDTDSLTPFLAPFFRVELARGADLAPDEHLGLISLHHGKDQNDPTLHEMLWVFQQTARFNQQQGRASISLDSPTLETLIAASSVRMASDAAFLISALEIGVPDESLAENGLLGSRTCVLIHLDQVDSNWVPGANATAIVTVVPNQSGEHTASVHLLGSDDESQSGASFIEARSAFATRFGIDPTEARQMTFGDAIGIVSKLLGYRSSETRFGY
jgi:hypothetical protein